MATPEQVRRNVQAAQARVNLAEVARENAAEAAAEAAAERAYVAEHRAYAVVVGYGRPKTYRAKCRCGWQGGNGTKGSATKQAEQHEQKAGAW